MRERKPDILLLADHFVEKYAREHNKTVKRISTPAIDMLMSYLWPGNVRELENCIERAVVVCDDAVIDGHHLPSTLQTWDRLRSFPIVGRDRDTREISEKRENFRIKISRVSRSLTFL